MKDEPITITHGVHADADRYRPRTEDEIRAIARGCCDGSLFASWMIPDHQMDLLASVFMPLLLLDDVQRKNLHVDNVHHFYGEMEKAMPRAIDGLPMFWSMGLLSQEDAGHVVAMIRKIHSVMDTIWCR